MRPYVTGWHYKIICMWKTNYQGERQGYSVVDFADILLSMCRNFNFLFGKKALQRSKASSTVHKRQPLSVCASIHTALVDLDVID